MDILYTLMGILIWILIVVILLFLEDTIIKKCSSKWKNVVETLYSCGKSSLGLLLAILPIMAILLIIELIYTCLLNAIF